MDDTQREKRLLEVSLYEVNEDHSRAVRDERYRISCVKGRRVKIQGGTVQTAPLG